MACPEITSCPAPHSFSLKLFQAKCLTQLMSHFLGLKWEKRPHRIQYIDSLQTFPALTVSPKRKASNISASSKTPEWKKLRRNGRE